MTRDRTSDDALTGLLSEWTTPPTPPALEARVLATYRRLQSPWRRSMLLLRGRRAPAAAAAVLLALSVLATWHLTGPSTKHVPFARGSVAIPSAGGPPGCVETPISLEGFVPVKEMKIQRLPGDGLESP